MQADLLKAGEIVGPVLIERGDTLTVTETSTGWTDRRHTVGGARCFCLL